MRKSVIFLFFLTLFVTTAVSEFKVEAAPAGPLIKHLSTFLKWMRASPKTPNIDGNHFHFETGYLVETVVEGNRLGVVPHSIRVSPEGELFAVDSVNSNVVRITPPLSQYSRARLVAGSFQGYPGFVDGKPSDARFNHPKGIAVDDRGNVYVADTLNMAIRKIGEGGVTTIAGGKSNIAGYRDGPSEDAKFSSDFDVVYMESTCSLLVVDRGNAALRQIALNREDCDHQHTSVSASDVILVAGAILVGYVSGLFQHGFGFSKTKQASDSEFQYESSGEKPTLIEESLKENPDAGWPSPWSLIYDLFKFIAETLSSIFFYFIPFKAWRSKKVLSPHRDSLLMPEDIKEPPVTQKQRSKWPAPETVLQKQRSSWPVSETELQKQRSSWPAPETELQKQRSSWPVPETELQKQRSSWPVPETELQKQRSSWPVSETELQKQRSSWPVSETMQVPNTSNSYTQDKPQKNKPVSLKDPSSSNKHRSSKRQDVTNLSGSGEPSQYKEHSSKSQKDRTRHRHHDKSREVVFGAVGSESKPVEIKSVDYADPKFDHYNIRSKYGMDDLFQF